VTPEAMSLLAVLRSAGLSLEARDGGTVRVRPSELLTPERRHAILSNKGAILAALELTRRVRAMAARWQYAADELTEALESSFANPAAWLLAVEADEKSAEQSARAGKTYPP
jgi:hypothetical protein